MNDIHPSLWHLGSKSLEVDENDKEYENYTFELATRMQSSDPIFSRRVMYSKLGDLGFYLHLLNSQSIHELGGLAWWWLIIQVTFMLKQTNNYSNMHKHFKVVDLLLMLVPAMSLRFMIFDTFELPVSKEWALTLISLLSFDQCAIAMAVYLKAPLSIAVLCCSGFQLKSTSIQPYLIVSVVRIALNALLLAFIYDLLFLYLILAIISIQLMLVFEKQLNSVRDECSLQKLVAEEAVVMQYH